MKASSRTEKKRWAGRHNPNTPKHSKKGIGRTNRGVKHPGPKRKLGGVKS